MEDRGWWKSAHSHVLYSLSSYLRFFRFVCFVVSVMQIPAVRLPVRTA